VASEAELADLFLTLRAVNAPLLRSFEEATAAGESMVTALNAMFGEIDAMLARTAESAAALRAELAGLGESAGMASTVGGAGAAAGAAEGAAAGAATTGAGAAAEREAAAVSTATSAEVASWDRVLAEMAQVRAETAATAQADAAEWSAMSTKMAAANERLIASTRAYGTEMAATGVKVDAAVAASSGAGAKLTAFSGAMKGPGIAAGLVGVAVVKMAADFETSTTRLVTSAGETEKSIGGVRQGILQLAGEVGVSAGNLSAAFYQIGSAGYNGAAGLGVLKAAEEGAKAENASGVDVAKALTSAMRDYYPTVSKASDVTKVSADVMSKFIATTSAGQLTFQDLASALHSVLPAASVAKVGLDDVLGALASMTVHGMSADQATQNMAHAIGHLQTVTAPQAKELALLGMTAQQVSGDLGKKGLTGTMEEIATAIQQHMGPAASGVILNLQTALSRLSPAVQNLGRQALDGSMSWKDYTKAAGALAPELQGQASSFATLAKTTHGIGQEQKSASDVLQTYSQALKSATGDQTGMNVALMLTGQNADYTNGAVKKVSGASADAKGNVRGWGDIQATLNQKLAEAKGSLDALAISVGEKLLPVASKIVGVFSDVLKWFTQHQAVAKTLAIVIGVVLVAAFVAATIAVWNFTVALLANPVVLIVTAIVVAIAAAAYLIISNWSHIAGFFSDVWHAVVGFFSDAVHAVGAAIDFWLHIPDLIGHALGNLAGLLGKLAVNGWHGFTHGLSVAWHATLAFLANLPHEIGFALGFLTGLLVRLAIDGWRGFTHGLSVAFTATVDWFKRLPDNLQKLNDKAESWLRDAGAKVIKGLWHGVTTAFDSVVTFFRELPDNLKKHFTNAAEWLHSPGLTVIKGLGKGIVDAFENVVNWFKNLPRNIGGFFKDVGSWLKDAGYNLVMGLIHGIENAASAAWHAVTSFASGLVSGFKSAMGISSPSTVMAEQVGKWIPAGIARGVSDNMHLVATAAAGVRQAAMAAAGDGSPIGFSITTTATHGDVMAASGPVGSAGRTTGGGITVNVYVAGSVTTENALVRSVQQGILQLSGRNSGFGLSNAFQ
jgi:phage-related protein